MQFQMMTKLLYSTTALLISSYLAFICIVITALLSIDLLLGCLVIAVILLLLQHYVYLRVQFDAALLQMLAASNDVDRDTQRLDESLTGLKLMPATKQGRDWSLRFAGCLRLLKIQILLWAMQYICLIIIVYFYKT